MIVIGVTGGSGSGKSKFCHYLSDACQAPIIDADQVYHAMINTPSACTAALADAFGAQVLRPDGSLNRPHLASLVFENSEAGRTRLATLNDITHNFVRLAFEEMLAAYTREGKKAVILDVPLLFESGFQNLCHYTVGILASREARLSRIMCRDNLPREAAIRRLDAQPNDDFYISQCNEIVYNNDEEITIKQEAERIAAQRVLSF
jgi:dephospho-CoA kinase